MSAFAIGIDTSYWESGRTDWGAAQKAGICFGVARAANGIKTDAMYPVDIAHMKAAGELSGDYLEFNILADPIEQAHTYFQVVGADKNPISTWIAFEKANLPAVYTQSVLIDHSWVCFKEVERLFNKPCGIYTGFYDWRDIWNSPAWSKGKKLWIARYSVLPPMIPAPFDTWQFWQFSDQYAWPGGHADGNYFNGSPETLRNMFGGTPAPTPAPDGTKDESVEARLARLELAAKNHGWEEFE